MSMTESAGTGAILTSDDYEEPSSVSLFKIKKKRPLMNPARKDTFGLMEMKKLQKTHAPADSELKKPSAGTFSPPRQKAKAIDLGEVGEEDEESAGEGQSLIHVENQVHGMTHHDLDSLDLDSGNRSAGSTDR
jgi:hypothetical protein